MQDLEDRLKELGDRVGRQVPPELRPTPRALRSIRVGRAVRSGAVLATVAALVIGAFAATDLLRERSSVQPADEQVTPPQPSPRETPENAEASGRRIDLLDGEVTFRTTKGWEEEFEWRVISEAPMGPESLLRHDAPSAGFLVITDPAPLQSCSRTGATVVSAEVLADAIRAHPGLSSTDPVAERVAGVNALRLDVAPVEGASTCRGTGVEEPTPTAAPDVGVPVITGTRNTALGPSLAYVAEEGKRMRLYLFDLPGGAARSLAIVIVAAEEDFNAAVEAARPILDSFEFHGAQQEMD
jgi:hypothetical protein